MTVTPPSDPFIFLNVSIMSKYELLDRVAHFIYLLIYYLDSQ